MPRPDGPVPPLTLYGCWEACRLMGDPPRVEEQIKLLEASVDQNPGIALDAAKSLIETVCKTVLDNRSAPADDNWDLETLVRKAMQAVPLSTDGLSPEIEKALKGLTSGIVNVAKQLGTLRNKGGEIGHGRAALARFVDTSHALYAARAADALVHLIYSAHTSDPLAAPEPTVSLYKASEAFNASVDAAFSVVLFDVPYPASEVLYRVDAEAYRNYLAEFEAEQQATRPSDPEPIP